jgi:hypothetical protein
LANYRRLDQRQGLISAAVKTNVEALQQLEGRPALIV